MQSLSPIQSPCQFLDVGSKSSPVKKDDNSQKSDQIFKKTVKDSSLANNSSIAEYHVTLHTTTETSFKAEEGVQVEKPSTETKTSEIAKKKKKKKKKSPEQQKEIVGLFRQSAFDLPQIIPPLSTQATSLSNHPSCPSFNNSEKELLEKILAENIFFEGSNLLEVFMGDFYKDRVKLIEISKKVAKEHKQTQYFHAAVVQTFQITNIVQYIFLTESYLLLENVRDYYFLKGLSQIFDSLTSCMQRVIKDFVENGVYSLESSISRVINHYELSKKEVPLSVTEFDKYIKIYRSKCMLLYRCSLDKNFKTFCLESKTNLWIESVKKQTQTHEQKLEKIKQLSSFIKFIFNEIDDLKQDDKLKESVNKYINSIENIIAGKIKTESLANFMRTYKQYALHNSKKIANTKLLEEDPKSLKQGLTNTYVSKRYNLELIDKWMSDLHEAICFHFHEKFNELGVSSLQAHLERLHAMIHIARTDMDEITRSKEDSSPDPFVDSIRESIQKLTSEIEDEFHKSNNLRGSLQTGDGELLQNLLMEELQKKPFQLTHLFSEMPKSMKTEINEGGINILIKQMNDILRKKVIDARNNNELGDWTLEKLKEKIQEILLDETLELCVYLLIMADINNLCSKDQINGFMNFLPNEIVSLLDLTGFEEIFTDTPVLLLPSESPITSEDEGNPITQQVEKPSCESSPPVESKITKKVEQKKATSAKTSTQTKPAKVSKKAELPTRQDFINTTKRNYLISLLEKLGFTLSKTHGKHPCYKKQGYRIPVPLSVQALGTRRSIYKQATAPLRNNERKSP